MIKVITTLTALFCGLLTTAQDTGTQTEAQFGGRTCDIQRGICAFQIGTTNRSSSSTNMKNFTTYKKSGNTLLIELQTADMSVEEQKRFFGKEYAGITANETLTFIQEDDYVFSIESLILIDLDINYKVLRKGSYPITIVDNKVQVLLTLSRE